MASDLIVLKRGGVLLPYIDGVQGEQNIIEWDAEDVPGPGWWQIVCVPQPAEVISSVSMRVLLSKTIDFGCDISQAVPVPPGVPGQLLGTNLGLQVGNPPIYVNAWLEPCATICPPLFTVASDVAILTTATFSVFRPVRSRRFFPMVGAAVGLLGSVDVAQKDSAGNTLDSSRILPTSIRVPIDLHRDCRSIDMTNNFGSSARLGGTFEMSV
jgi:hypothetical protein